MRKHTFLCDDSYEAEKLASLVSVQKDGTFWITGIAAVVGNEIVVQLKDKSSHAVVLKDDREARSLEDLLSQVIEGRITVRQSESAGPKADITVG